MSGAEIALIGALGGSLGAAAITQYFSNVRQRDDHAAERERRRDDYEQERATELRGVLDAAAEQFNRARRAIERLHALRKEGAAFIDAAVLPLRQEVTNTVEGPRYVRDRIAIRTGAGHRVHLSYEEALTALDEYRRTVTEGWDRGAPYHVPSVLLSRGRALDEQAKFLAEARVVAGVELHPGAEAAISAEATAPELPATESHEEDPPARRQEPGPP